MSVAQGDFPQIRYFHWAHMTCSLARVFTFHLLSSTENTFTNQGPNIGIPPGVPDRYYANLDFSDLDKNINWAKWIYDTRRVDTDSDGYAGGPRYLQSGFDLTDTVG